MMNRRVFLGALSWLTFAACSAAQQPASVDTRNDSCAFCRMTVSEVRFAGQIVAPGEEAKFFDDVGCLRDYLRQHAAAKGATAYVADHRTKMWTVAAKAVYVKNEQVETPMGSHLLAYSDAASRDADTQAAGTRMTATGVFGPAGPPQAAR
jgi:copper chaperone NosL